VIIIGMGRTGEGLERCESGGRLEVGGPVFFADEAVGFWCAGGLHVGAIPFDIFLQTEGDDTSQSDFGEVAASVEVGEDGRSSEAGVDPFVEVALDAWQ
jgi:hypothetical protein